MQKIYDLYLAGPFFSPDQKANCAAVRALLEGAGLVVCDPQELNPVIKDLPESERGPKLFKRIFEGNVAGLERSWAYIFLTDDKDVGTSWEFGYAYKASLTQNKGPLITLSAIGKSANVMLSQAANLHFATIEDFKSNLATVAAIITLRKKVLPGADGLMAADE